ncbi:unnamed protein product [Cunninghamella blakesleeana]
MTRNIILAIDPRANESKNTIDWISNNFLRPDDHIILALVVILDSDFIEEELVGGVTENLTALENKIIKDREEDIKKFKDELITNGFQNTTTHIFKTGATNACQVLIDYVNSSNPDALVMGSRNLTGWKRYIYGSFSDTVQSKIHCPVIIVHN